jgi:formylglycine-generating enzyme required for sulfatase activity
MPVDREKWHVDVRLWWRAHAADLGNAAAEIGVQGCYALLVAGALLPLWQQAGGDPQALRVALIGIIGGVSGNLLSNVIQGTRDGLLGRLRRRHRGGSTSATSDQALRRLLEGVENEKLRAALDELVDQAQAVDASAEALGAQWEAFAQQALDELKKLGGASRTSLVIRRISDVRGRLNVAGGDLQVAEQGSIAVKGGNVIFLMGDDPRQLQWLSEFLGRPGSVRESLPGRDAFRVVDGPEHLNVPRETVEAMPPPAERRAWLALQTARKMFKAWEEHFVPLAGVETLPVEVAWVRTEGEGPLQRRVLDEIPDLRQAFEQHPRFALLGDPGGGKTTLLRRLALEGLHACVRDERARIPFYVELSLHREGDPGEFLARQWQDQNYEHGLGESLTEVLNRGGLLLLADGLNEMPRERQSAQMAAWHTWLHTCCPPGNRMVFGCRTLDYTQPLELPQVEVLPLSPERVREYLDLHLSPAQAEALWQALQADHRACLELDQERRSLLTLVGNPFVLWATVQVSQEPGELPRNRGRLFERLGLMLLERQSRRRLGQPEPTVVSWRDAQRFVAPLANLAFAAQQQGESTRIARARALELLPSCPTPAETLTQALGARVLKQQENLADDELFFAHQLLQESFAAQELLRRLTAGENLQRLWSAKRLAGEIPAEDRGEWDPLPPPPKTGWEETTILTAGMAGDDLSRLLEAVRAGYPALAARCLDEAGAEQDVPLALRKALQEQLLADLGDLRVHLRARLEAGLRLGRIGDPRFLPTEGRKHVPPALCRVAAGRYLVGNPGDPNDPRYDPDAYDDEEHGVEIELPTFWIGRYPVTNAEYRLFVRDGGYREETWWQEPDAQRWRAGEEMDEFAADLDDQRTVKAWPEDWREQRKGTYLPQELDEIARIRAMSEAEQLAELREQSRWQRRDQPRHWGKSAYSGWLGDNQPVMGVSWYEARAYCHWLEAQWRADGLPGSPDGIPEHYQVRLPSEAEWEAAARGREGRRYPWGPDLESGQANTLEGRVLRVSPVGAYPEGQAACGALEMSGNVWEWTLSLWGSTTKGPDFCYPYVPEDGREDVLAGPEVLRVVRGGSWYGDQRHARCACRGYGSPSGRYDHIGFRVVVALPISPGR